MPEAQGYGQFCPVAKAAEVIASRWTPLILRELICGSRGFNEVHRGVPLMSRPLLSKRLKELQAAGVVERELRNGRTVAYRLTPAGEALRPIILAMGVWGQRFVESALQGPDWDAGVLMWDMRRRIDSAALPDRRVVLQFDYDDAPQELARWWLVVERGEVSLCQSDPGFVVDLFVMTSVRVMGGVWIGKRPLAAALEREEIVVHGEAVIARAIGRWLKLSAVVEAARERPFLLAS